MVTSVIKEVAGCMLQAASCAAFECEAAILRIFVSKSGGGGCIHLYMTSS